MPGKGGKKGKQPPWGAAALPGLTLDDFDGYSDADFEAYLAAARTSVSEKKVKQAFKKGFGASGAGSKEMAVKVTVTAFWSLAAAVHRAPVPPNGPHTTLGMVTPRFDWRFSEYYGDSFDAVAFLHRSFRILVVIPTKPKWTPRGSIYVSYARGSAVEVREVDHLGNRNVDYPAGWPISLLAEMRADPDTRRAVENDWEPLLPGTKLARAPTTGVRVEQVPSHLGERVFWVGPVDASAAKKHFPLLLRPNGVTRKQGDGVTEALGFSFGPDYPHTGAAFLV